MLTPLHSHIPIAEHQLGDSINIVTIAEASYAVNKKFAFDKDVDLSSIRDGSLDGMTFGCALVRLPNGINVLLDAANGEDLPGYHPTPTLLCPLPQMLRDSLGLAPEDIHIIIYSHMHHDHIGYTTNAKGEPYFPNAVHYMHRNEWEYAQFPNCPWHDLVKRKFSNIYSQGRLRLLGNDIETENGSEIAVDLERAPQITVLPSTGHTPGHIATRIRCDSTGETAIYIGDAMHFPIQVEQPHFSPFFDTCCWARSSVFDGSGRGKGKVKGGGIGKAELSWTPAMLKDHSWDTERSARSRRHLLGRIATEGALLVSPHFPSPSMGRVGVVKVGDSAVEGEKTFSYTSLWSFCLPTATP